MSAKVDWKHLFPASWRWLPSKRLFPESKERAHPDDEQLSASQDYGVISQKEFIRLAGRSVVQLNQHFDKRKRVERDDFVISMRSFQGGLERAWASGGIRSSYVVLKPTPEVDVGYFARLFKCQQYIQALQATALFIRDGQDLNYQNFCLVDLPLPSLLEQAQIAKFIDYETARIDALIEKQQQLIALLQEKRQAVISHAVTKGLNPDAPMRDSGVEWLGKVPAHWVTVALKRIARVQGGYAFKSDLFGDDGVAVVRIGDISTTGHVGVDCCKRVPEDFARGLKLFVVGSGEILMAMTGATIGKSGRIPVGESALMNQRVGAFKLIGTQLEYEFLWYLLGSEGYLEHIRLAADGGAQPNISDKGMLAYQLALPPKSEQEQIVKFLENRLPALDDLEGKALLQIDLLSERRTALISAAVTGKIDVRNWTPPSTDVSAELA